MMQPTGIVANRRGASYEEWSPPPRYQAFGCLIFFISLAFLILSYGSACADSSHIAEYILRHTTEQNAPPSGTSKAATFAKWYKKSLLVAVIGNTRTNGATVDADLSAFYGLAREVGLGLRVCAAAIDNREELSKLSDCLSGAQPDVILNYDNQGNYRAEFDQFLSRLPYRSAALRDRMIEEQAAAWRNLGKGYCSITVPVQDQQIEIASVLFDDLPTSAHALCFAAFSFTALGVAPLLEKGLDPDAIDQELFADRDISASPITALRFLYGSTVKKGMSREEYEVAVNEWLKSKQ